MGAESFVQQAKGASANEAFVEASEDARHWHGHAGYTGTIAEKGEFVMITPEQDTSDWSQNDYEEWCWKLTHDDDPRISDKWGPAGCVQIGDEEFIFFGWASS